MSLVVLHNTDPHRTAGNGCSYRLMLPDGQLEVFIDFERTPDDEGPTWANLGTEQCPNCPLSGRATCPAAADLAPVVDALGGLASVARLEVVVTQGKRETRQWVTGESAARAIVGLVMATSACPILGTLRPLALLHLPFATPTESTFRFAAAHLMRQFFRGETLELEGLRTQMESLHVVNGAFARRIKAACSKDAIPNAMTALFSLSLIVEDEAELGLAGLRALFANTASAEPAAGASPHAPPGG